MKLLLSYAFLNNFLVHIEVSIMEARLTEEYGQVHKISLYKPGLVTASTPLSTTYLSGGHALYKEPV